MLQKLTICLSAWLVDSIKWLRDDSIIIGCLQVNEDGEEEGYLVQVIKSKEHKFSVGYFLCFKFCFLFLDINLQFFFISQFMCWFNILITF